MIKTKYEIKLEKKQAKRLIKEEKKAARKLKRKERRLARREKRETKRFERKSEAKYRFWHRALIKTVRLGGPASALAYVIWKLWGTFTLETEVQTGALNLPNAIMFLFFGTVAFGFALWFGFKYLKTAIAANAVAANLGQPSLRYSPVVITFIRMILSMWFFGIMWLFNYIGLHYGEAMNNGMNHLAIAFGIGFGSALIANIIEQSILTRVRNQKIEIEDEARLMIKAVYDNLPTTIEEEIT